MRVYMATLRSSMLGINWTDRVSLFKAWPWTASNVTGRKNINYYDSGKDAVFALFLEPTSRQEAWVGLIGTWFCYIQYDNERRWIDRLLLTPDPVLTGIPPRAPGSWDRA